MKRIILVGKCASGKDHLRKRLQSLGYKYSVSYTTRPPRPGEIQCVDYIFITEKKAEEMIANNEFYELVKFNGWYYGTTKDQFKEDNLFIMTPSGLTHVHPEERKNSLVIYLDIPEEVRLERMLDRKMPGDTIERRLYADKKDFQDFTNYDLKITNPDF